MTEAVLPGVLIEVRPEALIIPGAITVGNLGVVGTAGKGPVGVPQLLGSYSDAVATFGNYDRWVDGDSGELTLTRALQQAYRFGATTVWAVRVADENVAAASLDLASPGGPCVRLEAKSPGTWGNDLTVEVSGADANAVVTEELDAPAASLSHAPVVQSAVNRILVRPAAGGADQAPGIVYDDTPGPTQVGVDTQSGALTFGTPLGNDDTVRATYTVESSQARKVTVKLGVTAVETYSVVSGNDLIGDLAASSLVTGTAPDPPPDFHPDELPDEVDPTPLTGGVNGATGADYAGGLAELLTVDAHLIVGAGQDQTFGNVLAAHCAAASGDEIKRERIGVVGTAPGVDRDVAKPLFVQNTSNHSLNSDRLLFVAPGIGASDTSGSPATPVTLPGAYAAAAIAGLLSSRDPHISLTNSVLAVDGLEYAFSTAELKQLVLSRILTLEKRQGFRVVRGITTSTNTAWQQITTRRIVDYAKIGVRSAATPYIGLLNNERVRGALRATLNSFLTTMVSDEMLVSYELDVHATRDDEINGRALVDLVIRPTFSIDFIKVTMFLE
jgi:Phage tail sheath C-terminal domain/Phage tail sheath protein subtilisin-like domain